jgi:hypothetical protein
MNTLADTIARAIGLRRAGRQYTGKCPSCGYASGFTVTERDGAILLYCHAGACSQPELWSALGRAGLATRESHRKTGERKRPQTRPEGRAKSSPASLAPSKGEAAALAIWRRSKPAEGTTAEAYLREARGCTGPIPSVLRFAGGRHPSDPTRWYPMMVAAVIRDGHMVAVHRTFLRADGRSKSNLDPVKMTLGSSKGAAVPLAPVSRILAVAEGIENGLSYQEATGIPTWAALSAGGIRNLILPDIVEEVIVAADPDPVGLISARAAAGRWLAQGRRVSIARPQLGFDFNDLARAAR